MEVHEICDSNAHGTVHDITDSIAHGITQGTGHGFTHINGVTSRAALAPRVSLASCLRTDKHHRLITIRRTIQAVCGIPFRSAANASSRQTRRALHGGCEINRNTVLKRTVPCEAGSGHFVCNLEALHLDFGASTDVHVD